MQPFELHLPVEQQCTALALLATHCELSNSQLKIVMQKGAVWLTTGNKTARIRRGKKELMLGQTLHIYYNEQALSDDFIHPILIEDCGEYSVWNKPCGMMSQGSKWGDHSTIARVAQAQLPSQRPAFIVHRLDRATQGLIVIAHSKRAVRDLTKLFELRHVTKKYQAVVEGEFTSTCEFTTEIDERSAYTKVSPLIIDTAQNISLVDVDIGSGRKHQIRRHLSEAGWPLIGDRLYGNADTQCPSDLQLCAYSLSFECPITGELKAISIVPQLHLTNP